MLQQQIKSNAEEGSNQQQNYSGAVGSMNNIHQAQFMQKLQGMPTMDQQRQVQQPPLQNQDLQAKMTLISNNNNMMQRGTEGTERSDLMINLMVGGGQNQNQNQAQTHEAQ